MIEGTPELPASLLVGLSDGGGGAAKATTRLHAGLCRAGISSTLVVRQSVGGVASRMASDSELVQALASARPLVEGVMQRLQRSPNQSFHSSNLLPSRWSRMIDAHRPDVVNLHWIGAGAMSIRDVGRISRPVVMTLHDMWGFCGSEHLSSEDEGERWRIGYSRRNRPASHRGVDLDRRTWRRKRRHWSPTHVVCPSNWLARCARQSALMSEWPIHVIPNALDTDVFRPIDQATARQILNLPLDETLLFFGAFGSRDPQKGFDRFVEVLGSLSGRIANLGAVLTGGGEDAPLPSIPGVHVRSLGAIQDEVSLALVYSAVDIVVVCSSQESLSQVATEAQACGTPVAAFDVTGLPDAVEHQKTGYLAQPFAVEDLAAGVEWILASPDRQSRLADAARTRAIRLWSESEVVSRYVEVYRTAIDEHHTERTA